MNEPEMSSVDMIKREMASRILCRRNLLPFVLRFKPVYDPGWVHKDICRRLEKFSDAVAEKKSPRLMLFMPPRQGKEMADSTPIFTANRGWTTHGSLKIGDYVYHPSGRPVEVLAVADVKHQDDYLVTVCTGETFRCHANHEWTFYDRTTGGYRTEETNWFVAQTKFGEQRLLSTGVMGARGGRYKFQLDQAEPLELPAVELPVDPYFLGVWLGDGSRGDTVISCSPKDMEPIKYIESKGYVVTSAKPHSKTGVLACRFSRQSICAELRSLGCLFDKFIPEPYLRASVAQRLELLAGLIDTDGSSDGNNRIRFATCDAKLRDGVLELVRGLGMDASYTTIPPGLSTSGVQGRKDVYMVNFQLMLAAPIQIPRKQFVDRGYTRRRVAIVSVEYSPNGEMGRCIQVDSPDGLYLVGKTLIPTHNSELVSRNFPAWHLGRHPEHEVITTSYSSSLALKFSRSVRTLLREPGYAELFPECNLDPDTQAAEAWMTTKGGGLMAAGVSGPLTGNGMHIGIIDDPVKNREEAESATIRESIKEWYTSTFYTRLAPGGGILVVMTRWHHDDLAGWLLEEAKHGGDQWEVVVYPAIAEEDEMYRSKGDALHPSRYPVETLEKIRNAIGDRDFTALYQQRPTAEEGAFFKREWFNYYQPFELPPVGELAIYTAWDLAIGKNSANDETAGVTVGVDRNHKIWLLDVVHGHWDAHEICVQILDSWRRWKPERVGIERGHIFMTLGPLLERMIAERNDWGFPFDPDGLKPGRADKQARAAPIQGRMRQGYVRVPSHAVWLSKFSQQILEFPNGAHDDMVDAFAWVGQMVNDFITVPLPRARSKASWRDRLGDYLVKSGGSSSHMAS